MQCHDQAPAVPHQRPTGDTGFTIIEVLIAMVILTLLATGVAGLFAVAIRAAEAARHQTSTVILATQKLEQLRSLTWGFDAAGSPVSDTTTDLSRDPPGGGAAGLSPSPPGALAANTPGYVDFLDGRGRWVGAGAAPPATAVYIRRWSIEPLQASPNDTLVVQVLVTTVRRESQAVAVGGVRSRLADEALIVTVKTRKWTS